MQLEDYITRLSRKINYTALVALHPADGIICTQPLGAIYATEQTTFRVWAPTASQVTLRLYSAPIGDAADHIKLKKNADGSWEAKVPGDLSGTYYTYTAEGNDQRFNPERELLDPYARAITAHNGPTQMWQLDGSSCAPCRKMPTIVSRLLAARDDTCSWPMYGWTTGQN